MKRSEYTDPDNLNFHYNRDERLKTLDSAVRDRDKRGFFKKNKQLKIILIDILIIVLAAVILPPLLKSRTYKNNVYGCNIRFECFMLENSVLASLIIEKKKDDKELPEMINAVYSLKDSDFKKSVSQSVVFDDENSKIYIRTDLEIPEDSDSVTADIIFGDREFRLLSGIKGK